MCIFCNLFLTVMCNKILMSTAVNSENQLENFKGWLFTMGEEYAKIKVLLSKVIAGNEEAEKKLNPHPIKVDIDEAKITRMELQLAHKHSEIAAATKALNFPNLEACAKQNMAYVSRIYKSITKSDLKPEVLDPQDYSQTFLAVLKEIEDCVGMSDVRPSREIADVSVADKESEDDVAGAGGGDSDDEGRDVKDVSAGGKARTGGDGVVVGEGGIEGDV